MATFPLAMQDKSRNLTHLQLSWKNISTLHGVVSTCEVAYCNTWSIWRCSSSSGTLHNPLLTPHTQFFLLWLKRCESKGKTSANSNDWMLIGFTIDFIFRFHTEKVWNSSFFFTFLLLMKYRKVRQCNFCLLIKDCHISVDESWSLALNSAPTFHDISF